MLFKFDYSMGTTQNRTYSNYTVDTITILYVVFLWIISKVNTLSLHSILSYAPPQLVSLMFKWTSLVIKAVATMLLLHQTVANTCTASMGPVWHTFGHPSDRDPRWSISFWPWSTWVWTLSHHRTHTTVGLCRCRFYCSRKASLWAR